jgi:hypothetical protein
MASPRSTPVGRVNATEILGHDLDGSEPSSSCVETPFRDDDGSGCCHLLPRVARALDVGRDVDAGNAVDEASAAQEQGHERQAAVERPPAELQALGDLEHEIERAVAPAHALADVRAQAHAGEHRLDTGLEVRRWIQCSAGKS